MKKKYRILFVGPPGSGKGTQAEMLGEFLRIAVVGAGKLFRDQIAKKTVLGKKIEKILKAGNLVPDAITNRIINRVLKKIGFKNSFILDGYPRNMTQAKSIVSRTRITHIFVITLDDQVVLERISLRRVCRNGHTYHLESKPPKKSGVCDICKKRLFVRSDSKPEIVKSRLWVYHHKTEPVLEFFQEHAAKPIIIKGQKSIQAVSRKIKEYL